MFHMKTNKTLAKSLFPHACEKSLLSNPDAQDARDHGH